MAAATVPRRRRSLPACLAVAIACPLVVGAVLPARVTYRLAGRELPAGRFFVELGWETRLELGDREVRAHFERQVSYRGEPVDAQTHDLVAVRLRPPLHAITFPERSYPRAAGAPVEPVLEGFRLRRDEVGLHLEHTSGRAVAEEERRLLEPLWLPLPRALQDGGPRVHGRLQVHPPGVEEPWNVRYRAWLAATGRLDPEQLRVLYRFTARTRTRSSQATVDLVGRGEAEWILQGRTGRPLRFELSIAWTPEGRARTPESTNLLTTWSAQFREPLTRADLDARGATAARSVGASGVAWARAATAVVGFHGWGATGAAGESGAGTPEGERRDPP